MKTTLLYLRTDLITFFALGDVCLCQLSYRPDYNFQVAVVRICILNKTIKSNVFGKMSPLNSVISTNLHRGCAYSVHMCELLYTCKIQKQKGDHQNEKENLIRCYSCEIYTLRLLLYIYRTCIKSFSSALQ